MADRNLVLQLLITAKDEASAIFGKIFRGLNDSTNVIATKVREAFTGLFGGGLDSAIEFEAQLSKVQAKGGLTAETMAELKQVAIDLGARFGVSGTEAAKGMESLAAAGLDAQQIIQTLPSVMALAKVESISMDDASAKLANSLTAVGLGFDQAGRMADVLSKAALESTTSASAVAEALSVAGGIATSSGLSFEQAAAALTALAKGGIEGSNAGTALSAILTQLINPASTASIALNNLGISSRDLGEVIGALQQRGDAANTAILAFGETAGPGLRTLITQGQAGLNDLTAAMQNAGGSAQATADTMGGNLQGAMNSLVAAWDSVKTALFDPVLEPLTKSANDFASALNTNLKDGALKPVQEAIKSFAENSLTAVREFIGSFDFTTVIPTLTDFAASAKESFGNIADSGRAAADTMTVAWNAVTIILRGIGITLAGFSTTVITTVESLSFALNAMGLVSDTVQARLAAMATSSQNYVVEMRNSIVKDSEEMGAAWNRLTSETEKTTAANRRLKEALPAQELKSITYSLNDYARLASLANIATEKARKEYEAGKISGAAYAVTIQDAAEANTALSRATDAAAAAAAQAKGKTSDHAKELQGQIGQLEVGVTQSKKYADAVEGVVNAESEGIRAAIRLAQAKGDTAEVQRLTIKLTEQEADGAVRIAKAKQLEQEAEAAVAQKKLELAQIQREKNQITNEELALAELTAQKEVAEAQAAGVNTEAQIQLAAALRQVNAAKSGASSANTEHAASTEKSTEATNKNAAANRNSTDILKGLVDKVNNARKEMAGLSENTQLYFDVMLANELKMRGFAGAFDATRVAQNRLNAAIGESNPELAKLESGLATAKEAVARLEKELINSPNSFRTFELAVEKAKGLAIAAFNEQAIEATKLTQKFEAFAESGSSAVGGVAVTMHELRNATMQAQNDMGLLDQQRLDALRGSIEAANQKLVEMQQEAQSAQDRIAELNAEIAAEKGDTATADRLKLELDQQQQIAEVEAQLAQARAQNNRELITLYEEQKQKLEELYDLKSRNLEKDIKSREEQERAAKTQATTSSSGGSGSGSGSAGGKTYNLNLNAGGKTLNAVTNTDPGAWLDDLERARRGAA